MIKKLIFISIKSTSLNHMFFAFLLLIAYTSYTHVAKEMFPPSSFEMIVIEGKYQGSNASILDKLIVRDIEYALQNNQNLCEIKASISNASFYVSAKIKNASSKEKVVSDIKSEVLLLKNNLPTDMVLPSVKSVESFFPLMSISISSTTNLEYIEIAKDLADKIKHVKNLHSVEFDGDYEKILLISLNEQKLIAYHLSKQTVYEALRALYSLNPIGSISSKKQKYYLETHNTNIHISDILNAEIKIDNVILYVKDIANVHYAYERKNLITRTNAKDSVAINIKKAKLGDSIALSKEINNIVSSFEDTYTDIHFEVLSDSSFWIKNRLNTISSNIFIGLILLFFSIWLFISLRIAIVVLLGIPVSFAFGFIGLEVFEASLNTLSMIGVLLSLGILVDEAIVVSENIHRHINMGKSTFDACVDGTYEMMPILFASMLTTIVAFLPLTMITGGVGLFIKIIPIIVIILVVSSFIESFIFLPLHYKLFSFIKESSNSRRDVFWEKLAFLYKRSLAFLVKRKYLAGISLILFTLLSTAILVKNSKFQLFAEFDAMSLSIMGKVKNGALEYTLKETKALEKAIIEHFSKEDLASVSTLIGINSDGRSQNDRGDNLFTITLHLQPKQADDIFNLYINPLFTPYSDTRPRTRQLYAKEILAQIQDLVKEKNLDKEFLAFHINIPQTGVVKNDIEISLSHISNQTIQKGILLLQEKMSSIAGLHNIKTDMVYDEVKLLIHINSYGKLLGFTQKNLVDKIHTFVSSKKLSKLVNTTDDLVQMKLDFHDIDTLDSLYDMSLKLPLDSKYVSLKDICSISFEKNISTINKENLKKVFMISASFDKTRLNSTDFYKHIQKEIKVLKDLGIEITIKGEKKAATDMQNDIALSFAFALFSIIIILTWLFHSLRLAIFALSVIPLSLLGVLLGHFIMGEDLSFSSLLGFVGLIGIIMNDTLIMLSFIKNSNSQNELLQHAAQRLRPILLTSITTVIGLSTLIFFASGESLLMQPIAISIGFGLIWATIINLYYLPLLYAWKN